MSPRPRLSRPGLMAGCCLPRFIFWSWPVRIRPRSATCWRSAHSVESQRPYWRRRRNAPCRLGSRRWIQLTRCLYRRTFGAEGIDHLVDFHQLCSHEFWPRWQKPIRLLWHDGANDRSTVVADVRSALPHLVDGAIVAFHDVRNPSGERLHVFLDEVLGSPHFGASGVCETIGWSQYRSCPSEAKPFRRGNDELRRRLERLRPYHRLSASPPHGWRKVHYKVLRWLVPHDAVPPERWLGQVSRAA